LLNTVDTAVAVIELPVQLAYGFHLSLEHAFEKVPLPYQSEHGIAHGFSMLTSLREA
jgi:hypothetical protein